MKQPRDPETPNEWQLAVDAADACLALDAARQYGLVAGGPKVDVERALWIVAQGKLRGIQPRPDAIKNFLAEIMRQDLGLPPEPAPALHVAGTCPCGGWHNPDGSSHLVGRPLTEGIEDAP